MPTKYGYWNLKGLGQSLRNFLHYIGEDYEERTYDFGPAPDFDRNDWLNEKFTLGLKYPNLPYYMTNQVKLTQSLAILRHLARKHNLNARNEAEQQEIDMIEQQLVDAKWAFIMPLLHTNHVQKVKEYFERLPQMLKLFSDILEGKKWLMGDRLTYVDFLAYDVLDFNVGKKSDCLDDIPNLKNFKARFENLPQIKKYFATEEYKNLEYLANEAVFDKMR